ncbi:hypothetical protein PVAP13_6KG298006 [Panicum virgatum]|uniref:Uncharacterized protein n=1 Tax=Panicum virgatum TaxID=38727 RepID=A0A8T0RGU4_PANVG|nr:hypothetical protein PVAP13_6KG298006 [Panicum virgatum]
MVQGHAASGAARGGSSDRDAATQARRARRGRQRPGGKEEGAAASAAVREGRHQEAQDDGTGGLVRRRHGGRGDDRREAARSGEEGVRRPLGSELGCRRRGRLAPGRGPDDGAAVPVPGAPAGRSRCALHQDVPGRSWMEQQKSGFPLVGGDGEVLVPMVGAGHDAEVFAKYSRWRKNVRMPSRFYVQHVQVINAGQE